MQNIKKIINHLCSLYCTFVTTEDCVEYRYNYKTKRILNKIEEAIYNDFYRNLRAIRYRHCGV